MYIYLSISISATTMKQSSENCRINIEFFYNLICNQGRKIWGPIYLFFLFLFNNYLSIYLLHKLTISMYKSFLFIYLIIFYLSKQKLPYNPKINYLSIYQLCIYLYIYQIIYLPIYLSMYISIYFVIRIVGSDMRVLSFQLKFSSDFLNFS